MTRPMTDESNEVGSADVRARIVAAAVELFGKRGYAGTSLREIAERARTTKPMIYYYFRSKEGLYLSTLGDLLHPLAAALDRAVPPDGSPLERLRAFCDGYLAYFQAQEPHVAFIVREVFGLGGEVTGEFGRTLDDRLRSRVRRILTDGIERGQFRAADVEMSTTAITGILNMFILRRVFGGQSLDRAAAVEQVVDYYVEGLRAR